MWGGSSGFARVSVASAATAAPTNRRTHLRGDGNPRGLGSLHDREGSLALHDRAHDQSQPQAARPKVHVEQTLLSRVPLPGASGLFPGSSAPEPFAEHLRGNVAFIVLPFRWRKNRRRGQGQGGGDRNGVRKDASPDVEITVIWRTILDIFAQENPRSGNTNTPRQRTSQNKKKKERGVWTTPVSLGMCELEGIARRTWFNARVKYRSGRDQRNAQFYELSTVVRCWFPRFCPFRPACLSWTSPSFPRRNPILACFLVSSGVRSTQTGRVRTMPMHPMPPAPSINSRCLATDQLERLDSAEGCSSAATCSGPESMRQTLTIHNYCEDLRR